MITSSNGNNFRVTGPLWGESTGDWWISPHKGHWCGALIFFICARTNGWSNNQDAGDLRSHRIHYDVTLMWAWAGIPSDEFEIKEKIYYPVSYLASYIWRVVWPCISNLHWYMIFPGNTLRLSLLSIHWPKKSNLKLPELYIVSHKASIVAPFHGGVMQRFRHNEYIESCAKWPWNFACGIFQ